MNDNNSTIATTTTAAAAAIATDLRVGERLLVVDLDEEGEDHALVGGRDDQGPEQPDGEGQGEPGVAAGGRAWHRLPGQDGQGGEEELRAAAQAVAAAILTVVGMDTEVSGQDHRGFISFVATAIVAVAVPAAAAFNAAVVVAAATAVVDPAVAALTVVAYTVAFDSAIAAVAVVDLGAAAVGNVDACLLYP